MQVVTRVEGEVGCKERAVEEAEERLLEAQETLAAGLLSEEGAISTDK